jgi:MoxR-like ATPase
MRRLARDILMASSVAQFIARLVRATHPDASEGPEKVRRFVRFGASPRGAQALALAAKVHALRAGRFNVSYDDVRSVALPALRHRLILGFEAEAEGVGGDAIVADLLGAVRDAG